MIVEVTQDKSLTKVAQAKQQGLSLSSLYYHPLKPQQDRHLKNQMEAVLRDHPSYGEISKMRCPAR